MHKNIEAIFFDFDGTLVFLPIDYARMRERLQELFLKYSVESDFHPLIKSITDSLSKLKARNSPQIEVDKIEHEAYFIIEDEEVKSIDNSELAEGAKEVLSSLKEEGCKIAIVSRNGRKCINQGILKYGLPEPDLIISRDELSDLTKLKPHPEQANLGLAKLNLKPENTVIIGDSFHDIEMGKFIGLKTILIDQNKKYESEVKPDFKINKLNEIFNLNL
jgi:pyrophosphatase PpaX